MLETLTAHASAWQAAVLLLALVGMLVWERVAPWLQASELSAAEPSRPLANYGLLLIGQVLPVAWVPLSVAWIAALSAAWPGRPALPALPAFIAWPVALLALDATAWLIHCALHRSAWLWRLHQVHHSDLEFDSSLAFRFHPLEALLYTLAQATVVTLLQLPVAAVLVAGLLATAHNIFVHANVRIAPGVERWLQWLVVTPAVHRVHHSADAGDAMHNFGVMLPWWDRLARCWRAVPPAGTRRFGLAQWRQPGALTLPRLLLMPLRRTEA